jgi:hypothetical protein
VPCYRAWGLHVSKKRCDPEKCRTPGPGRQSRVTHWTKIKRVPAGTAENVCEKFSRPCGDWTHFVKSSPGLNRPGLLSCRPFGTATRQAMFSAYLKNLVGTRLNRDGRSRSMIFAGSRVRSSATDRRLFAFCDEFGSVLCTMGHEGSTLSPILRSA